MKVCTINTDAGFLPRQKVGSFAYWIKSGSLFLRGSGLFKDKCNNSTDAERKAIVNALHVLEASNCAVEKIIINRDNVNAKAGKNGDSTQKMMSKIIRRIKKRSIQPSHPNYTGAFVEFRHVKAHKHTETAKNWVNDWCDKQCKQEIKKYLILERQNQTKAE